MNMDFGVSEEDLKGNDLPPLIDHPYVGGMRLESVERDEDFRDQGYDVLIFDFVLTEGEEEGQHYRHVEWKPREGDKQSKVENLHKRLFYIAKYFAPLDVIKKAANLKGVESYEDFWEKVTTNVLKVFANHAGNYTEKDDLKGKIVGSTYDGQNGMRSDLGFTNYIGFLSDDDSEHPVSFSKSDKKSNKEYLAFENASADDEDVFEEGEYPEEEAEGFSDDDEDDEEGDFF